MDEIEYARYLKDMNCIREMIYAIFISEKLHPPYTMSIINQTVLNLLCEHETQEMHGRFITEMNQRDDIPEYIFDIFNKSTLFTVLGIGLETRESY